MKSDVSKENYLPNNSRPNAYTILEVTNTNTKTKDKTVRSKNKRW